jgi:hypothetical protein
VVISKWKAEFLENLSATFERSESTDVQDHDTEKLYAAIGQLKVEARPICSLMTMHLRAPPNLPHVPM